MANAPQKTPVSLLQQLSLRHGLDPEYQLISTDGAAHAPTFTYRVQVNEIVATATRKTKKKAKHAAAKSVLEQLLSEKGGYKEGFILDGMKVNSDTLNYVISEDFGDSEPVVDENCPENAVGQLHDICTNKNLSLPYYELERVTGLQCDSVFSIMCIVDNFTTSGEGKTKRLAKRKAAENMLKRLNVSNVISADEYEVKEPKEE